MGMQLFIRSQDTYAFDVTGEEKISDLKLAISENEDIPLEDLALYCNGLPLNDDSIIGLYASDMSSLDVEVRLLGGKVNGSLARAGKVKGQTPKVDKQEKKKKKTGRAKRRIQYNRRFVNVVPTFGKKKGPNANS